MHALTAKGILLFFLNPRVKPVGGAATAAALSTCNYRPLPLRYPTMATAFSSSSIPDDESDIHTPASLRNRGPILEVLQSLPWVSLILGNILIVVTIAVTTSVKTMH